MVNCNPETVSTDYDTADRLYFEPLTFEDVLEVVEAERAAGPVAGVICTLGGQTPLGLAQRLKDAGVPVLGTSPEAIDDAEHRGAFSRVLHDTGLPAPKHGMATTFAEAREIAADHRLPGAGPALLRARRPRDGDRLRRRHPRGLHRQGHRRQRRPPGAGRPVPGGRRRDRRRRPLRRHRPLPRRGHGAHRGGRHPLRRLGVRPAADHPRLGRPAQDPGRHGEAGRPHRRPRADERPVRDQGRHPLRDRGQPPGQPHGAVRLQGDRGAAGQGRGPDRGGGDDRRPAHGRRAAGDRRRHGPARGRADRGQGGGAALPPVPHRRGPRRRHRALAGDEVHRRGHGPRHRVRHGVRQVAGRRLRLAAHRGHGLRLAGQPGQALGDLPDQAAGRPRLPRAGHRRAPRRCCAATGSPARWSASSARAPATCVERILAGDVDIVVNTPFGSPGNSGPRLDGYEIRTAAVAAGIPCITTVQGMAAAVQGIEALRRGDIGVRSLQEVHAALAALARRPARERAADRRRRRAPAHPPVQRVVEVVGRRPVERLRRADAWPRRRSPSAAEPGQFVAFAVGGRDLGAAAAPLDRDRRRRRRRRHRRRRRRTGPARPGWPGCGPGDAVDVVGPLGRPFPLPAPGTPGAAGRRRLRRRGAGRAWPRGCARPARAVDRRRRRRVGRPAVLGRGARRAVADDVVVTTDDGSAGPPRLGHRRRRPSCSATRAWSTPAGRWGCCARSPSGHRRRGARPTSRSRSRWPAGSASA